LESATKEVGANKAINNEEESHEDDNVGDGWDREDKSADEAAHAMEANKSTERAEDTSDAEGGDVGDKGEGAEEGDGDDGEIEAIPGVAEVRMGPIKGTIRKHFEHNLEGKRCDPKVWSYCCIIREERCGQSAGYRRGIGRTGAEDDLRDCDGTAEGRLIKPRFVGVKREENRVGEDESNDHVVERWLLNKP
jgi:hypothetical protein